MTGSYNTIQYTNTVTWAQYYARESRNKQSTSKKNKNTDTWRFGSDIRDTNKDGELSAKEILNHNDKVRKLFAEKICDYRDGKQFLQPCDWFDKKHYQRLYTDTDISQEYRQKLAKNTDNNL